MVSSPEGFEALSRQREAIAERVERELQDPTLAAAIRAVTDVRDINAITLIGDRFQSHIRRTEEGSSEEYAAAITARTDFGNYLLRLAHKY